VCPYDLFENTKSDLGQHPNREVHDDAAKEQWDALPQEEKDRWGSAAAMRIPLILSATGRM
jgi:hypothetical protein